jgi:hypothetical protein
MPVFSQTTVGIYAGGLGLSAWTSAGELSAECTELDATNWASGGWTIIEPGLAKGAAKFTGMNDMATVGPSATFTPAALKTASTLTVTVPGTTVADPSFFLTGRLSSEALLRGNIGDLSEMDVGFAGDGRMIRGQLLHPSAARSSSGSGTATTFTTPVAGESLWAAFHVLAVSGAGTITFTVQTDDNAGMTTPTTRITSTGFTAIGGQFTSAAGPFAGETHIRAGWTISGFTSVTFVVSAGTAA